MWWLFAALIVAVAVFFVLCSLGPELTRFAPSVCPVSCFPSAYHRHQCTHESDALLSDWHHHEKHNGTVPSSAQMISALADCKSSQELESALQTLDVASLLDSTAKAQYFVQLCRDRCQQLSVLTVKSLARIVSALEPHAVSQQVAQFVQECLCTKPAKACTALKMEVDQLVSLYDLVYCSIQNKKVRDDILAHFDVQAAKVKASGTFVAPIKLVSDIDDTTYAGSCDARFPEYTIYPGARQFTAEVLRSRSTTSANKGASSEWDAFVASVTPRQCFLTDRPEALKAQMGELLRQSGFSPITVLTGNLMNVFGSKWVMSTKTERIKCLVRLFAEFQFVFVGDNGQNDVALAKVLLSDPQTYPMAAVLIHDVAQNTSQPAQSSIENSQHLNEYEEDPEVSTFRTYVTAAFQLFSRGMLSVEAVGRIIRSTISDLSTIEFNSETQKRSMTKQVMSDISLVVDKLPTNQDAMVLLEGFHERRGLRAKRQTAHKLSVASNKQSATVDHIV
ncbi:hypothetical protein Gpo141_00012804 [Globisporangium polare]